MRNLYFEGLVRHLCSRLALRGGTQPLAARASCGGSVSSVSRDFGQSSITNASTSRTSIGRSVCSSPIMRTEVTPRSSRRRSRRTCSARRAFTNDWDSWAATDPSPPDIVIPAANDRGVRASVASYSHPMALTGTTSRQWTAELHLYRAGDDGCIDCRHPTNSILDLACSTSAVPTSDGGHTDAALSFLSGTAGLHTLDALARLQAGVPPDAANHWQLSFQSGLRPITANRHCCSHGCRRTLDAESRRTLFGETRWYLMRGGLAREGSTQARCRPSTRPVRGVSHLRPTLESRARSVR
jgi:hypothetical protein